MRKLHIGDGASKTLCGRTKQFPQINQVLFDLNDAHLWAVEIAKPRISYDKKHLLRKILYLIRPNPAVCRHCTVQLNKQIHYLYNKASRGDTN